MSTLRFFYLFLFACYLGGISPLYSAENSTDYEGWAWNTKFEVSAPHLPPRFNDPKMDQAHLEMQEIVYRDRSIKGKLGIDKKEDGKNIVLLRLGMIIREGNGNDVKSTYLSTDCFKRLICFSGSDSPDRSETNNVKKFNAFYQVDPIGYSFTPRDVLSELNTRFPVGPKGSSLSQVVYERCSYRELSQPVCLLKDIDRTTSVTAHDTTAQSLERFKTSIYRLHDRHAHSEPRLLFFLNKEANTIPAYWDFHIELLINEGIKRVQEFLAINHELFKTTNLDSTLQNFHQELLTASVRIDMTRLLEPFQELHREEMGKDLEKVRTDALQTLKSLRVALDVLATNQLNNPLKLELFDPLSFRDKAASALRNLEELLHRRPYKNLKDLQLDKKVLDELKTLLPYQDSENDEEDWRFDLVQYLRSFKGNQAFTDLVFHLHSLNDICEDCAPMLAREWERNDGFLTRLKSWIMAYNGNFNEVPSVHLLISCSNIRKVALDRHASIAFNKPVNPPVFTQVYMLPPADAAEKGVAASAAKRDVQNK